MDPHLAYVLGLCGLGLVAIVVRRPLGRTLRSEPVRRFGTALVERFTPEPEPDELAEELRLAIRRERLIADTHRLQRIVANDEHMSAVRQIGNRLAYGQLLLDLQECLAQGPGLFPAAYVDSWAPAPPPPPRVEVSRGQQAQYNPKVETLELGWRR